MDGKEAVALIHEVPRWSSSQSKLTGDQEPEIRFRFMDLPAEIRNMIYPRLVTAEYPIRLAYVRPPAVNRVSRQVRSESLPIYFDINIFVMEVRLNYNGWFMIDKSWSVYRQTGTLRLKMQVIKLFKAVGSKDARIKNLAIIPEYPYADWLGLRGLRKDFKAYLGMIHLSSINSPSIKMVLQDDGALEEQDVRGYKQALEPAKAMLETMVAEPGYKALTLSQLKKVANCFRVKPAQDGS